MDRPQGLIDLDFRIRRLALVLMYIAIFAALGGLLYIGRPAIEFVLNILSPFIVALIVAYIFNPVVSWLQRKFHLGRIAGVLITYALILALTVGFFAVLVPILYKQLREGIASLVIHFPQVVEKASNWLQLHVTRDELAQAKELLRQHINLGSLTDKAGAAAGNVAQGAFDTTRLITRLIGTTVSVIIGFFAFVSFVVVICFYFLLDYNRFEHIARVLLPDDKESRVFSIWSRIDSALGGFLRGQLIVATTIGILYTVGLMAMGMKEYAILIGFLAGFGNMIPYLGPVLGGVPAALWVLFGDTYGTGQEKLIGVGIIVAFSVAIQSLDGFFLQPRIVGKNAELHPLLVLLALLIGAQFGLGGMIIAVPLAIMVRVVLKELWWDPLEEVEFESKRRARVKSTAVIDRTAPTAEAEAKSSELVETTPVTETGKLNVADILPEGALPRPKRRRRRR